MGVVKSYKNLTEEFRRGKAWEIWDEWFARDVERAAMGLKIVGPVLFCSNIGVGAYETVQAYRDGQDWIKEAIKETADMATFAAIGAGVAVLLGLLGLTSIGWIAALGVGATEAVLNKGFDDPVVNPLIERYA